MKGSSPTKVDLYNHLATHLLAHGFALCNCLRSGLTESKHNEVQVISVLSCAASVLLTGAVVLERLHELIFFGLPSLSTKRMTAMSGSSRFYE